MSNDPQDNDFDWVTVRHQCTAATAFPRLRDMTERSIETRRKQIESNPQDMAPPEFTKVDNSTPTFSVRRGIGRDPDRDPEVRFRQMDTLTIKVDGTGLRKPFEIQVAMDDGGNCQLLIDDVPRKDWQILHRALDDLLFGPARSA